MPQTLRRLLRKHRFRRGLGAHAPSKFETEQAPGPTFGLIRDWHAKPEQIAGVGDDLKPLLAEPGTLSALERDDVAIPGVDDREGYYGDMHLAYWLSGLADLRVVQNLVPAHAFANVLDFGGATGRFARHLTLADRETRVTIAELNVNHVNWVEQHFGPRVRAIKVSPYPHFPLSDRSMSLCVGFSVFTHINSYESGWLAEIHRVLADGGYALLTIHSEETWPLLPQYPHLLGVLNKDPRFMATFQPGQPMPNSRLVYDYNPNSIEHNCNVFAHSDHIRRVWGKWFEVVDVRHRGHHGFQAVVVLRKRG